jgi:hypothetical protein
VSSCAVLMLAFFRKSTIVRSSSISIIFIVGHWINGRTVNSVRLIRTRFQVTGALYLEKWRWTPIQICVLLQSHQSQLEYKGRKSTQAKEFRTNFGWFLAVNSGETYGTVFTSNSTRPTRLSACPAGNSAADIREGSSTSR